MLKAELLTLDWIVEKSWSSLLPDAMANKLSDPAQCEECQSCRNSIRMASRLEGKPAWREGVDILGRRIDEGHRRHDRHLVKTTFSVSMMGRKIDGTYASYGIQAEVDELVDRNED